MKTADHHQRLKRQFGWYLISAIALLCSLSALTYAEFYMAPSQEQELLGLVAIIIGAIAGVICALAYLSMIWQRLRKFFKNERM
jgi:nitrate reductase gamma subunit